MIYFDNSNYIVQKYRILQSSTCLLKTWFFSFSYRYGIFYHLESVFIENCRVSHFGFLPWTREKTRSMNSHILLYIHLRFFCQFSFVFFYEHWLTVDNNHYFSNYLWLTSANRPKAIHNWTPRHNIPFIDYSLRRSVIVSYFFRTFNESDNDSIFQ